MADVNLQARLGLDDSEFSRIMRKSVGNAEKAAKDMGSAFAGIGGKLAGVFSAGAIVSFGKSIFDATAQMEDFQVTFDVLAGSAEKGKRIFSQIKEFGAQTPFEVKDLSQAAQTLLNFGVSLEDVMKVLRQLGDISGGNSEKLNSLALAFGQASSTGRLMGQDLLQMINAGFNPLKIISEKTGTSMGELKKQMEAGSISIGMVRDAMTSATTEGGLFFGMMEKKAQTLSGQVSTLKDAFNELKVAVGNNLFGGKGGVIGAETKGLEGLVGLITNNGGQGFATKSKPSEVEMEMARAEKKLRDLDAWFGNRVGGKNFIGPLKPTKDDRVAAGIDALKKQDEAIAEQDRRRKLFTDKATAKQVEAAKIIQQAREIELETWRAQLSDEERLKDLSRERLEIAKQMDALTKKGDSVGAADARLRLARLDAKIGAGNQSTDAAAATAAGSGRRSGPDYNGRLLFGANPLSLGGLSLGGLNRPQKVADKPKAEEHLASIDGKMQKLVDTWTK